MNPTTLLAHQINLANFWFESVLHYGEPLMLWPDVAHQWNKLPTGPVTMEVW